MEEDKEKLTLTPDEWRVRTSTPLWLHNGALVRFQWPLNVRLTEDEYNKAIHETANCRSL